MKGGICGNESMKEWECESKAVCMKEMRCVKMKGGVGVKERRSVSVRKVVYL